MLNTHFTLSKLNVMLHFFHMQVVVRIFWVYRNCSVNMDCSCIQSANMLDF